MYTLRSRVALAASILVAVGLFALGALAARSAEEPVTASAPVNGDVDCSGDADAVDALQILRWVVRLPVSQTEPCTPIGGGVPYLQGDVDCSGNVDAVDALKILRYVVRLPVTQAGNCAAIGGTLTTPTPSPSPAPTPTPTPTPTTTPTPSPTPTPTPTATPTATPMPTLSPDGWLGCAYATDWNGGDDTSRVCVDGGQAYPEPLLEGTSCDPDPSHGAVALWNLIEVPPTGLPVRLRLDMYGDAGAFACVKVSNHIVTYEITLSTSESSYYLDLPGVTEAGTYQVWVEFRSVMATNRYAWLDFAGLQSPVLGPTPTP